MTRRAKLNKLIELKGSFNKDEKKKTKDFIGRKYK
jgi:hypothetical protein